LNFDVRRVEDKVSIEYNIVRCLSTSASNFRNNLINVILEKKYSFLQRYFLYDHNV